MGPLFQLAFAIIFYLVAASMIGLVLYVLFRLFLLVFSGDKKYAGKAFWFPWKMAPYFLLALVANIFVCEYIREVDAPLTDYWSIEIGQDAALGAIDTLDEWMLWPSREGGEVIVGNVSKLGFTDKVVFIQAESGLFRYWLSSDIPLEKLTAEQFAQLMSEERLSDSDLITPEDYYYDNRELGDLLTLIAILGLPLYWFGRLVWNATRSNSEQRETSDASAI